MQPENEQTPVQPTNNPTPEPTLTSTPAPQEPVSGFIAPVSPTPRSGNSKKTLGIILSIIGVLLLAGAAVLIYFLTLGVSKDDYKAAYDQTVVLQENTKTLKDSGVVSDSKSTEEYVGKVRDNLANIKSANEKLSSLKAVKTGEGAELYKKLNDKVSENLKQATNTVDSYEKIAPIAEDCSNAMRNAISEAIVKFEACTKALDNMGTLPYEPMDKYAKTMTKYYKDITALIKQVAAGDATATARISERAKAYTQELRDSSSSRTSAGNMEYSEEAKALEDYLKSKSE